MENRLKAGFARVDATPPLGIGIDGYYKPRFAEAVYDALEINALALECGGKTALVIAVDNCGIKRDYLDVCRAKIEAASGVPKEAVFIHSTHTHTGPYLRLSGQAETEQEKLYSEWMLTRFADAAMFAVNDLVLAKMGYAVSKAEKVGFLRRFRMKDGSTKTNPGVNNPDILEPIGEVDERVNVLRFTRDDGKNIIIVNYGNHPDVVGGNKISADWPGFARRITERALDNVKCIFINGAQGDVNHVNVHPQGGDLNDTFMDFDDVSRGYGHSHYVGSVVAGAALSVFDKVFYTDENKINYLQKEVSVPSNMPRPEDMEAAYYIEKMHAAGKDEELPYKGMQLTTYVAEAERMIRLEHGPESFPMLFSALSIGNIALFGIPGEPFTGIGTALKKAEGWDLVLPCCLVNGSEGYFPMKDAYEEGGYEARSSPFKEGVAELIIKEGLNILNELKNK